MRPETARRSLNDIGMSRENAEYVASLLTGNKKDEARRRLRILRCELIDELHACQKRVDQLDWLIRETEKQQNDD